MEFPKWKKRLKHFLSSVLRVAVLSKNVVLSAGLLTLTSANPPGQPKVSADP
jgi:hypothetical protein